MAFELSQRSIDRMKGVNPDLVNVVKRAAALSDVEFIVTEGLRTPERQAQLFKAGATRTLKSKHLVGRAVDLAAVVDGKVRWDWPLYSKLADSMKRAAEILNVRIEWGGDWISFKDGPHFQLKD